MNNGMMTIGVTCVVLLGPAMCAMAGGDGAAVGSAREATMPSDKLAVVMVNAKEHGAHRQW